MSGVTRGFKKTFNRSSPERQAALLEFASSITDRTPAEMIVEKIHELLNAKKVVRVKRDGPKVDATGRDNAMLGDFETITEPDYTAINHGLSHALEWRQFVAAHSPADDPAISQEQSDGAHMDKLRGSPVYLRHVLELALGVALETDEGREIVMEIIERIDERPS